jgi:hypothetical protein
MYISNKSTMIHVEYSKLIEVALMNINYFVKSILIVFIFTTISCFPTFGSPGKNEIYGKYSILTTSYDLLSPLNAGSPSFDSKRIAYIRSGDNLLEIKGQSVVNSGNFKKEAMIAIDRDVFRGKQKWDGKVLDKDLSDESIVFDDYDFAYTIVIPHRSNLSHAVLLWSPDRCRTWRAIAVRGRGATLEKKDTFTNTAGPPTVISFDNLGALTGPMLWLETFRKDASVIVPDARPALVSSNSLIGLNHSGGGNSTFTTAGRITVVYASNEPTARGTAIYARIYDRVNHRFVQDPVFLGYSDTKKGPDAHDLPAISGDRAGKLYVIFGAHQAMLKITELNSGKKNAWSVPLVVGQPKADGKYGSYTYASLNISQDGTINIFARSEGDHYKFQLVQLQRLPNGQWRNWENGLLHRVIAEPNRTFYSAWRQRVTTDNSGRLYLNFRFYVNDLTEDEANSLGIQDSAKASCRMDRCWYVNAPTGAPVTLRSSDNGSTWTAP